VETLVRIIETSVNSRKINQAPDLGPNICVFLGSAKCFAPRSDKLQKYEESILIEEIQVSWRFTAPKKKKTTEYLCGGMSLESELSKQTYEKRVFAFFSVF
jgi:hypothetical protein